MSAKCWCKPTKETRGGRAVVVHRDASSELVVEVGPRTMSRAEAQKVLGTNLRAAREEAGLSQVALAGATGIPEMYVYRYERGMGLIPLDHLGAIAGILGVGLDDLCDGIAWRPQVRRRAK